MQPLQLPAIVHKAASQPIEQFRMARPLAEDAKITRRRDNPAAEVMHPEPIDEHSGDEGVLAGSKPIGVGQAAAGGGQGWVVDWNCRTDIGLPHRALRFLESLTSTEY